MCAPDARSGCFAGAERDSEVIDAITRPTVFVRGLRCVTCAFLALMDSFGLIY
jgi:hypothetical protein